jgi:hypothetical protein
MTLDFRVSTGFFTHKKTLRLIRKRGYEGPWYLLRLWAWAREHFPDGNLEDTTLQDIDDAISVPPQDPPFSEVLLEGDTLYLVRIDGKLSLYNWEKHNSWAAKSAERSEIARKNVEKRWERERKKKEQKYGKDTTGIPKGKIPDTPSPSPSPLPKKKNKEEGFILKFPLDFQVHEDFRRAWGEWEQHRKEIKKKLTPMSVTKIVNDLKVRPIEEAVRMIDNAIAKGWQGIYEISGPVKEKSAWDPTGGWGK